MENTYGIGVKNRYELFYNEEEDPLEILKQQEEEKERRKAEKLQKDKSKSGKLGSKEAKTVQTKKKEATQNITIKAQDNADLPPKPRISKPFIERTGKQNSRDEPRDMEERKNRRNREDRLERPPLSTEMRDRNDGEIRRGRGGGRGGRGRGRGRGSFGNFDSRNKRELDRQSGSDRSSVKFMEKRDGSGAHNWGNARDDMEIQMNPPTDDNQEFAERSGDEGLMVENTETKENEPTATEENAEPVEEAPKEMTLDEWKREQEANRSVPKFNLRKPGEGEDTTQWKKLYVLKKKARDEDDDDDEEEEDDDIEEEEEFGRRGRQRHLVDIQINFSDSRRGRGRGRGGRGTGGRGRGGMNRSGAKGPKSEQQLAPRVDDWNDFPSLISA
uniref:Plasminogen activator inhibitor 1 RNA-binding protein n=1 Tax=Hadrurus spadix TaxID=141984 RepID=A0A1W7RA01_9SCOR